MAACELSCEKLRADETLKAAAANGDDLEVSSGRELRSILEAVEAIRRLRDAIAEVGVELMTDTRTSRRASELVVRKHRYRLHNPVWL